jgi:hypothetical protein
MPDADWPSSSRGLLIDHSVCCAATVKYYLRSFISGPFGLAKIDKPQTNKVNLSYICNYSKERLILTRD